MAGGDRFAWVEGARRFETWESSYVNVLGLGTAVEQALGLGVDATASRALALGQRLRDGLDRIPGVQTHDLGIERCAIVTVSAGDRSAEDVKRLLAERGINVTTTDPQDNQLDPRGAGIHPLVRFSPHYYNTEDEIDRAIEAVTALVRA
jgi:selenocysteine lyase/cysteine desulfurase